jgi:hypothetical protein
VAVETVLAHLSTLGAAIRIIAHHEDAHTGAQLLHRCRADIASRCSSSTWAMRIIDDHVATG